MHLQAECSKMGLIDFGDQYLFGHMDGVAVIKLLSKLMEEVSLLVSTYNKGTIAQRNT